MLRLIVQLLLLHSGIFAVKGSTEQCAGYVQVDSPDTGSGTGKLPCLDRCTANVTSGDVVQWEITFPNKCVCDYRGCPKGFCKRVLFLSNGSFQLYDYDNNCGDRVLSTGDTRAYFSRCWSFAEQMNINHTSGSLNGPYHVWNWLKTKEAVANCSVLQEGCLNDPQPVEVKDDQLYFTSQPKSDIHYAKCSPELTDTKGAVIYPEPVRLLYGSSNHICLSVTLKNDPPVSVVFNGEDVDKTELQLGGGECEACSTECYENISNELGRGALHAEVVMVYWRNPCLKRNDVIIYIPFTSVNSSDSGNWTIKLPTQSVVYQTSVEINTTKEFSHKPPQMREVMTGGNAAIPCDLLTPINQSDDSISWKGPSGDIEVRSTNVSTNFSADLACQVLGREGSRVFVVRESKFHYSQGGTLRRHSLVLYVCDATTREGGTYSCGVQDNGTTLLATTRLSVQESIADPIESAASMTTILSIVLVLVLFLIVVLLGVTAVLCLCLVNEDLKRRKMSLSILRQQSSISSANEVDP